MKTVIKYTAALCLLSFAAFMNSALAQDDSKPTSKSYVKIKTMKIVNGDTIVTEKEYTGDGNMNVEDSLGGNDFGNFSFRSFNDPSGMDFPENFSHMQDMFKDFNFGGNDLFFKNFQFPEFQIPDYGFDIDSIIKEFNFRDNDTLFPNLGDNKVIIKSFKDKDREMLADSLNKPNSDMDVHIFGRNDKGQPISYNKKITIIDKNEDSPTPAKNELPIEVFPNPAEGFFNVSFYLDPKNKTIIQITDLTAKVLLKETMEKASGMYTRQFDMKDYAKGNYLINIKQGKKSATRQIIIE